MSPPVNSRMLYEGARLSLAAILRHLATRVEHGDPTAIDALGDLAFMTRDCTGENN